MQFTEGQEVTIVAVGGFDGVPVSLSHTTAVYVRTKRTGSILVRSNITGRELTISKMEIQEYRNRDK